MDKSFINVDFSIKQEQIINEVKYSEVILKLLPQKGKIIKLNLYKSNLCG